jgi:hypothetical protein
MKSILIVAAMAFVGASAARAEQGPPSMSSAQAAAYAACVKKANKEMPDFSNNQVASKYYRADECAKAAGAVGGK